jgi:hypothetical protein
LPNGGIAITASIFVTSPSRLHYPLLTGLALNQLILLFVHRPRPYAAGVSRLIVTPSADWSSPVRDRLREQLERLSEVILPLQDRCHRMMIRSLGQLRSNAAE